MKAIVMQKHMPLIAMIFVQFIFAGLFLLSKAAISSGMKPSVFVTYRQAIATLVLAPFAFFCERKNSSPLMSYLLCKIFIVSSCGLALSLNLTYDGLKCVSATFATALTTTIPTMVFIIAVCSRIESLAITQRQGLAIVFGLTWAMIYTFYKGPSLYSSSKIEALISFAKSRTKEEWVKGSIVLFAANLSWIVWLTMQALQIKAFNCKMKAISMQKHMPLVAMITTQFIYAAMFLLSKAAISSGMKPSVFVAYRQAAATLALAPLAFFYDRKKSPPLTCYLLCKIFIVSSCGISLSLNLHYIGLRYVSATFATAITNTIPAMVFIIAICTRIEKLAIAERQGLAKVIGSILGLTGAMVYTFYKGPPIYSSAAAKIEASEKTHTKEEWIKGSLFMLFANLTWAMWLIMQTPILKQYPAKLQLTTMQIGFSCLTTTIYGAIAERNISSWKLGWNVNLFSVAYCGIIVTALTYTIQVWVVEKRGPVFTAIFSPLALILTAIFSALIFHETLHWGSALGGVLLVGGLYAFLWGKNQEAQINEAQQQLDHSREEAHLESIVTSTLPIDEHHKERIMYKP